MKKMLFTAVFMAVACSVVQAGEVVAASPIKNVLIGNSLGWKVKRSDDGRSITLATVPTYVTATDLVLETESGLEAFDIAKDGRISRNDDRRVIHDNGQLEFAPARLLVVEMPDKIEHVEVTRPLALQMQIVADGRYLATKYAPFANLNFKGPRRITVTTASGRYSFDVVAGKSGAPIYKLGDAL